MRYLGSKTLETERLLLHKTEEKDLKVLWNILLIKEVSIYYLTSKINKDWEEEKKWQYKKLEKANNPDTFIWTIELKDNNVVIGQISLHPTDKDSVMDIGWFIDLEYQKKGYAFEAAQEVLKYMFIECELERIETCCCKKNSSSFSLMERLGFKRQKTTREIKYTLLEKEEECYDYTLVKNDFLKEYFRRDKLYITLDIDKDPYIKHISDDLIVNITGESGSGKTTLTETYMDDEACIVIDTDHVFGKEHKNSYEEELYKYLINKYKELPDLCMNFDEIYKDILNCFKDRNKTIIIDSAQYRNMKDLSLLKGDIMVLRTCINNCYNRCLKRYESLHEDASLEEIAKYSEHKKKIYKWYHLLNHFLDRLDRGEE